MMECYMLLEVNSYIKQKSPNYFNLWGQHKQYLKKIETTLLKRAHKK